MLILSPIIRSVSHTDKYEIENNSDFSLILRHDFSQVEAFLDFKGMLHSPEIRVLEKAC